jgi:hypothetical protein
MQLSPPTHTACKQHVPTACSMRSALHARAACTTSTQHAHLAARKHAPDGAHQRRLARVHGEPVAARDAAEQREEVADAGDGKGEALGGAVGGRGEEGRG